jgi:plasmid stability protein
MPSLSVRQLDEETVARLRARAASHGVSMEEEARRILKDAVSAPERLGDLARQFFGPRHGVDLELSKRAPHAPIDLSE